MSVGQAALVPVQTSAISHVPTEALQLVPDARNVPVAPQFCLLLHRLLSHAPAAVRQTVPVAAFVYWQNPLLQAAVLQVWAAQLATVVQATAPASTLAASIARTMKAAANVENFID